ncbi:GNAT family N-acetyltransferase [Hyphomonas sp. WL0036]|uniref:GNAT family N-acetyltransferase n=1 Tax=Hyphomonas sediminis TaxID=2866160 RepID=UPI001C8235A6|nr:GNAT family N-acetyltransferase [Hyphomonas sediminis]MBY9068373.1 GNAT family N-acetyltransferase [Hyphomonas sediminis]
MSIRRPPAGYMITGAAPEEIPALIEIDLAAGKVFEGTGLLPEAQLGDHVPADVLREAMRSGHLHVARHGQGELAGFALTSVREGWLYLDQISVDPAHGRGGVGSALMSRVMLEAKDRSLKRVTLSTFRDPPWNGPFYRKNGFKELPRKKMEKWMIEIESIQDDNGLIVRDRCFMARRLGWL